MYNKKKRLPKAKRVPSDYPIPDYTNIKGLLKYLDKRGKIVPRAETGLSAKQQKLVAKQIKRARHLALVPFV